MEELQKSINVEVKLKPEINEKSKEIMMKKSQVGEKTPVKAPNERLFEEVYQK